MVLFRAEVTHLIPLYAIGVFTSFTLSQAGMARRQASGAGLALRPRHQRARCARHGRRDDRDRGDEVHARRMVRLPGPAPHANRDRGRGRGARRRSDGGDGARSPDACPGGRAGPVPADPPVGRRAVRAGHLTFWRIKI
ncbi:MAG: hypothetical protein C4344_04505 [Acidimicrobiia bacterium]